VILVGACAICVLPKSWHTINSVMIYEKNTVEEEVLVKVSCLTTVEGARGRSNDPREEVRTANNEQRGRERDQTTPNTSNARRRLSKLLKK